MCGDIEQDTAASVIRIECTINNNKSRRFTVAMVYRMIEILYLSIDKYNIRDFIMSLNSSYQRLKTVSTFYFSECYLYTRKGCSLIVANHLILIEQILTRAPLGYFYNAPYWGGGLFRAPPLISETTGPILKIQAAFESPGKTVEGKKNLLTSGSRVTSQVRSKSKCSTFRAW